MLVPYYSNSRSGTHGIQHFLLEQKGFLMPTEKPGNQDSKSSPSRNSEEGSASESEYAADVGDLEQQPVRDEPNLLLDVPALNIDELELEVEDLQARVALSAELADFVKINAGVTVQLEQVKLHTKGLEVQALLEVKMERVLETINRALEAIDRNPGLLNSPARQAPEYTKGQDQSSKMPDATIEETTGNSGNTSTVTNITGAASRQAERLGVDPTTVVGTGSGGRITVKDVRKAAKNGE